MDSNIDLNKELVRHPSSTFYGRVKGDSMIEEGINEGDILVIDKALDVQNGDLAVCYVDGDFTLKRVEIGKDAIYLISSNSAYKTIKVTSDNDFLIWGVVTYVIKNKRKK